MKRLLLPLLAALALPNAVNASIPEEFDGRWLQAVKDHRRTFMVDTEDVVMKGTKLRFFVKREIAPERNPDPNILENWQGKLKIDCEEFTYKVEVFVGGLIGYQEPYSGKIKKGDVGYDFANNFCFLTGVEGYTPEPNPEPWAKKIIDLIKIQKTEKKSKLLNINCFSPFWKNKPRCN